MMTVIMAIGKFFKKIWPFFKWLLYLLILAGIVFFLISSFACSFSPVRVEGIPEECNLCYSAMRFYYKAQDKSGSVAYLKACQKVMQRERCKTEIFGKDPVNYDVPSKYRNFSECLKELDD